MKNDFIKRQLIRIGPGRKPQIAMTHQLQQHLISEGLGMRQIMEEQAAVFRKKHEEFIMKALEKYGHTFETPRDIEVFARTRCNLVTDNRDKTTTLYVDRKAVCMWQNNPQIEINPDPFNYTVSAHIKARIL